MRAPSVTVVRVVVGHGRLDDPLCVIDDRLKRVCFTRYDEFDAPLGHAHPEPFPRSAGDQCSDTVERMPIAAELMERHLLGQVETLSLARQRASGYVAGMASPAP